MNLLHKFCRDVGLMIHHIIKPPGSGNEKQQISRKVEEKKLNDNVTLRRTTIEEIEVKQDRQD
ncbi:MAG: hypothetical protein IT445_00850 [Phycisphaeraceae bacterium]|nr:hypothetical protein [Phycisphaeraceae bacterium]